MRLKTLRRNYGAAVLATLFAIATNASEVRAQQGGDILGIENITSLSLLLPTFDGPLFGVGLAELQAVDNNGTNTTQLNIQTLGLDTGTYTVSVTTISDGSTVVLGTFDVQTQTLGIDWASLLGDSSIDGLPDSIEAAFGESGFALPDGFNPMDIATIDVSDSFDVVVLEGDLTDLSLVLSSAFDANVDFVGGPAAPSAGGTAAVRTSVKKSSRKTKFSMQAHDTPPNSTLTLNVNGTPHGTVKSNRRGQVKLKKLPDGVDPSTLTSIQLLDADTNVVCTAQF